MNLSYSSISAYQKCPLSYKLQYVEKLPTKKTSALSFGSSIHSALEFMYNVPTPNPPSLDDVLNTLVKNWVSEGYVDEIDEQNHLEHARRVLEQFYLSNVDDFKVPVVLEHKFFVDVDGINLVGVIDRIDKLPTGGYEIIDYKTNKRLPPKAKVDEDLQLSIYHLAVEKIWGFAPEKLSLYFVLPNQKMSSSRTNKQIEATRKTILEVAEGITSENFPAVENALCPWCDFQAHCPYFKDRFADVKDSRDEMADIRALVDRYIELNRSIKKAEAEQEELKSAIHSYCADQELARVYGAGGYITRREQKHPSYDMEKLKESLEPVGLWDGVVRLDMKSLNQLLSWPDLPDGIREAIEDAKEKESVSYALYVTESAQLDRVTTT